ncbi:TonB-dependent siderophore receptor, putative [Aggregatibacter actinomycetemcomitans HK1651]|nr:TonB-dependent siderophore receptor, putative [Aggregatibacter actinomycetemcomitans HK1651]
MKKLLPFSLISLAVISTFTHAHAEDTQNLDEIQVTAEQQVKQSLGVSVITEKDLERNPIENDASEIIAKQPGVTLSTNAPGGARGNKRQVDIRAMGPENTLILVNGKPVKSRNSERYGRNGMRNTRGDTNWVPADAIESIEVLRGPAAARYGSGAMGGVVNIKTKAPTAEYHGSLNLFTEQPEDSKEGHTNRLGFNFSGPLIKDVLGFRLHITNPFYTFYLFSLPSFLCCSSCYVTGGFWQSTYPCYFTCINPIFHDCFLNSAKAIFPREIALTHLQ